MYHTGGLDRDVAEQPFGLNDVKEDLQCLKGVYYAVFTDAFDFVCRSQLAKELKWI
jgi:hypothetical protein